MNTENQPAVAYKILITPGHTLLKQMSTAGSFNLTVALPSSTNQVKNFSILSLSCNRKLENVSDGKIHYRISAACKHHHSPDGDSLPQQVWTGILAISHQAAVLFYIKSGSVCGAHARGILEHIDYASCSAKDDYLHSRCFLGIQFLNDKEQRFLFDV